MTSRKASDAMSDHVEVLHEESWSDSEAWVLFRHPGNDQLQMEFWHNPESYGDEGGNFTVYSWDVAPDVISELDWVDWDAAAQYLGMDVSELQEAGRSQDAIARAQVYASLIGYYSSEELDSYPLSLTPFEMHHRWPKIVNEPDIDFTYVKYHGPHGTQDRHGAEGGLFVELSGAEVTIREWLDIEAATGEPRDADEKVLLHEVTVDLEALLDPKAPWRKTYAQDHGDDLAAVEAMPKAEREDAIVSAAISRLESGPTTKEYVDYVGDY